MKKLYYLIGLTLSILLFFTSCISKNENKNNDWNVGQIEIVADSNLQEILDPLVVVYENYFPNAKIIFKYVSEEKAISDFKKKGNKAIAISRLLDDAELNNASIAQDVVIEKNTFVFDAIAVITNNDFQDSIFKIENINEILKHKTYQLVFDPPKSGIASAIQQISNSEAANFKNAYSLKNTDEVLNYVATHSNAIGFIPYHLLSNKFEKKAQYIRSNFKTLPVSYKNKISNVSQKSIADEIYPLVRPISIYIGNCPELVIQGFTSFLLKRQISKALLLSGLVPKNMPVREIVVTEEFHPNGKNGQ
ncbi:MAG TPA: substrate-binding domain-containing protein [Chitinophagales bacterium]|jgi:phosphate transport system substrate-binding protein|nr:substrate-binding domain-containing protein [Chitinophagales bacterium]MBP6154250.1 substrate-binding domain-containing protein [Chitinophagales bacterium]HQV78284.1 substrate-binding domain-containing protein [Chitinophagales bacterium]HQW79435.1 substrate-binding domain-containing protein [Chitinophagales bacterium]HRB18928.1 substrate-binding domain-containing protein [Chitinophagales bacterium]